MKVLHVISGDLWAGAEVQAFTLLTNLRTLPDMQVAAALMNDGELAQRLRGAGIPVTVFPEHQLGAAAIVRALRQYMRTWRPDVVHTHRIKENILGCIANRLAHNVTSVRTAHGAEETAPARGLRGLRDRTLLGLDRFCALRLQSRIISVSPELATRLSRQFPTERVVTVENGIDVGAVRARMQPAEFRQAEPDAMHVGLVGRLVPVKRVDLFLEMAALLQQRAAQRRWRFHVFGDGPLLAESRARAQSLGIAAQTTFHGHRQDIPACLAALDVLVISSDHEGLPMTLLETLAVGTPVAAHEVGGMTRVVEACDGGRLVRDHSPQGYADAVLALAERGRFGASRLHERYSAAHNARETAAVYHAAMGAARGTH